MSRVCPRCGVVEYSRARINGRGPEQPRARVPGRSRGCRTEPLLGATICLLALVANGLTAQGIPFSQPGAVFQRVGFTDVTISYNRPVARGRRLFGALVRWDQVWHPGADSATTITFSRDVWIEDRPLAAGGYTLWTIPDSTRWTVVFSRAVHVFHTPYPGDSLDALRVDVTPQAGDHMEVLAFYFPVVGPDTATLRLHWGTIIVPIRIRTTAQRR